MPTTTTVVREPAGSVVATVDVKRIEPVVDVIVLNGVGSPTTTTVVDVIVLSSGMPTTTTVVREPLGSVEGTVDVNPTVPVVEVIVLSTGVGSPTTTTVVNDPLRSVVATVDVNPTVPVVEVIVLSTGICSSYSRCEPDRSSCRSDSAEHWGRLSYYDYSG
ncbi:hypothetical protein HBI57_132670 [Parastagonospora nodorum]|nr:hypothetical protein HBI57_132670 [Parastagonospora nodorum]